ncbi:MAG: FAD-dependent oxidoreductase [Solirubrobacterales bacterium]
MSTRTNESTAPEALAALWQPLEIGPATVRNRVALGPLSLLWAEDSLLTERHLDYYEERARGGIGLVISEQHRADRPRISFNRHGCSALDPRCVDVFKRLGERVHSHGATQFIQLFGPGILDSVGIDIEGWEPIWSAGPIPSAGFGEQPLPIPTAALAGIVESFARAAANVAAGGLDGVELHAARSELLGQFLSPLYNHRADGYGGSAQARCRLPIEIAEAIHRAAPGLAVGIQISIDEYMGDAATTEDSAAEQLGILAASKQFDFANLSTGNEFSDHLTIPPMEVDAIPAERFGARAKSIVGADTKILVGGGVRTVEAAARLLAEGAADLVAMSRASLADPEIVAKARAGRAAHIRPCLGQNDCLLAAHKGHPVACLVNPVTGRERLWGAGVARPRRTPRRVLVVGGGPAGMQAAIAAAGNGHEVSLFERSQSLGGHMALLGRLPHRQRWQEGVGWYAAELDRKGVEVGLGTELTAGSPQVAEADVVLCATGARWAGSGFSPAVPTQPSLPGADQENVIEIAAAAERALADAGSLGGRVLILDESGGYLPLGVADVLSAAGVEVTIATRHGGVGTQVAMALDQRGIFKRLAAQAVEMRPARLATAVDGDRVAVTELWSGREESIDGVDTVVLSLTREPHDELQREIVDRVADVRPIGDAFVPRRMAAVIAEGQSVGFEL